MKNQLSHYAFVLLLLFLPNVDFAQVLDLGAASCFALFTTTGAVSNTAISSITGDIGTNTGAISGFNTVHGSIYNTDSVTAQSSIDLHKVYHTLSAIAYTYTHIPVLGNGETLRHGVYYIASAGSALNDLYMDAQGDSMAIFIVKFGGAFTTAAGTNVHLINGAVANNLFWVVEGAISMGAGTIMRGNMIANNGAVGMGANGYVEGRLLSTTGAVSVYQTIVTTGCQRPVTYVPITLPVALDLFTADCTDRGISLEWTTASETDNDHFTIERSHDAISWQNISEIAGAGNSTATLHYSYSDPQYNSEAATYYRLKQTDFDNHFSYSSIRSVSPCQYAMANKLLAYPNPSTGKFRLSLNNEAEPDYATNIFNAMGVKIAARSGFQADFDLSDQAPGVYFISVLQGSKVLFQKIIVQR